MVAFGVAVAQRGARRQRDATILRLLRNEQEAFATARLPIVSCMVRLSCVVDGRGDGNALASLWVGEF
jgi:hypothetical protein